MTQTKRQRLSPALHTTSLRSDSVTSPETVRDAATAPKRSAPDRAAIASHGLLSPKSTPQKRQHFQELHFADAADATDGMGGDVSETARSVRAAAETAGGATEYEPERREREQVHGTADIDTLHPANGDQSHSHDTSTHGGPSPVQTAGTLPPLAERSMDGLPEPLNPRPLHDIPMIAERYVPKTSTAHNIEYTNPQKFSLKPAYCKAWKPDRYIRLAEYARNNIDLVTFARSEGMPVEEAQHHFHTLIINPLYDSNETSRRDKEGMLQITELYNKHGMPLRYYGRVKQGEKVIKKGVNGELTRVEKGLVVLITANGSKHEMPLRELTAEDIGFLIDNLTGSDKGLLWDAGPVPYHMGTEIRTWTSKANGRTVEGKLSIIGKGAVTLVLPDKDKTLMVKVDKVIEADVVFLRGFLAPRDRMVMWSA